MKRLLMLMFAGMILALSSCDKDDKGNNVNNNSGNGDTSGYNLGGGYWSGWYDDHHLISFQFDREWLGRNNYANTPGKLIYQELYDQDWGIGAHGSYKITDDVITANFNDVSVRLEDYSSGSYHGYTDGVTTTKRFTIKSCTSKTLVVTDELGRTHTLTFKAFVN